MKRLAFKLLVFLLLGAIINIAVAWGCVLWSPIRMTGPVEAGMFEEHRVHLIGDLDELPDHQLQIWYAQGLGRHEILLDGANLSRGFEYVSGGIASQKQAGWPMYGLVGTRVPHGNNGGGTIHTESSGALPIEDWMKAIKVFKFGEKSNTTIVIPARYLPYLPVPTGFAINTIFYAAMAWALFTVPGAVRRRVRIRRGQCASCGYSLRGSGGVSDKCPECGAAVGSYPTELRS